LALEIKYVRLSGSSQQESLFRAHPLYFVQFIFTAFKLMASVFVWLKKPSVNWTFCGMCRDFAADL